MLPIFPLFPTNKTHVRTAPKEDGDSRAPRPDDAGHCAPMKEMQTQSRFGSALLPHAPNHPKAKYKGSVPARRKGERPSSPLSLSLPLSLPPSILFFLLLQMMMSGLPLSLSLSICCTQTRTRKKTKMTPVFAPPPPDLLLDPVKNRKKHKRRRFFLYSIHKTRMGYLPSSPPPRH